MSPRGGLAVVIPARNESERIGTTVRAAVRIPGVDVVVVVDDGSTDGTGSEAAAAGGLGGRHSRNRGKAAGEGTGAGGGRGDRARAGPPRPPTPAGGDEPGREARRGCRPSASPAVPRR